MTEANDTEVRKSTEKLHHVIAADKMEDGDRVIIDVQGREIAVFHVDGEWYAVSNYCTHQGGPVCEGLLDGTLSVDENWELTYEAENEIIACPWHGWEFDIKTGEHLSKSHFRLPTYDVVVRNGEVYVDA